MRLLWLDFGEGYKNIAIKCMHLGFQYITLLKILKPYKYLGNKKFHVLETNSCCAVFLTMNGKIESVKIFMARRRAKNIKDSLLFDHNLHAHH